jgi:hypothetical protein
MFGKLDEITGTTVFAELYDQHVAAREFPDLAQTWRSLGITTSGNALELSADERESGLRDAIMQGAAFVADGSEGE